MVWDQYTMYAIFLTTLVSYWSLPLTLSYPSDGSPALSVFRHHELKIVWSYIYLDFLTTVFLYLVVTLAIKKILGLVLVWKSRALLPTANNTAECSGGVWQPSSDSNGRLAPFFQIWSVPNGRYFLQRAVTPNPASSNFLKKCAKWP